MLFFRDHGKHGLSRAACCLNSKISFKSFISPKHKCLSLITNYTCILQKEELLINALQKCNRSVVAQLTITMVPYGMDSPSKVPLRVGESRPHLIHGSLGPPHQSLRSKRHLHRFSRFCTAHGRVSLYFTFGSHFSLQCCLFPLRDLRGSLGPPDSAPKQHFDWLGCFC